jgi:hypothetical protein
MVMATKATLTLVDGVSVSDGDYHAVEDLPDLTCFASAVLYIELSDVTGSPGELSFFLFEIDPVTGASFTVDDPSVSGSLRSTQDLPGASYQLAYQFSSYESGSATLNVVMVATG